MVQGMPVRATAQAKSTEGHCAYHGTDWNKDSAGRAGQRTFEVIWLLTRQGQKSWPGSAYGSDNISGS